MVFLVVQVQNCINNNDNACHLKESIKLSNLLMLTDVKVNDAKRRREESLKIHTEQITHHPAITIISFDSNNLNIKRNSDL